MGTYFIRGHKALDLGQALSAFRLFTLGAKRNDESCQQVLGYLYDEGIGISANTKKAIYWYEKACMQGRSSAAAFNLYLLYQRINQNDLANKFLKRAAELDDDEAAKLLQ